jgi:ERCC4-type nuclease
MSPRADKKPKARGPIPADIEAGWVTGIVDTREQYPLDLAPLKSVTGTLTTGDYSLLGLTHHVAIERKSEADLIACIGVERERYDREVQRLLAYPVRALVVESTWERIEAGEWRTKVTPAAAIGSLLGWIAAGLPVVMAGNHERAGLYVSRLLFTAARRRWRESRGILTNVLGSDLPHTEAAQ